MAVAGVQAHATAASRKALVRRKRCLVLREIWAIITANFGQMGANAFKIGDKVRFLNDVGEGRVTAVQADGQILVEDDNGFEYAHPANDLIPMESRAEMEQAYERVVPSVLEILQQEMDPARQRKLEQDFKSKYKEAQARPSGGAVEEVDLHLHAIVDSQAGLSPGVMLELQIAHFERMLQIGIRQRTKKMIFIHGIGQGVLRHQIWSRVEQYYPDCSCRSADPRQYGNGATEVWIGEAAFRP
jgi:hypothetical protein